jgi:uncharacterized membrane protein
LFFGRLHPLLVHLPIGLILLLALLELLARSSRFKHANACAGVVLALAVPAALVTVICGWLLSLGGGYADRLLQFHKWTGIATAAVLGIAALLYWLDLKKPYRWCLISSALVLIVASHFGGSLTHGSDYLTRYAPAPIRSLLAFASLQTAETQPKLITASPPTDPQETLVFGGIVQPILSKDCISCHGPEKSKAKLRFDSLEAALKGGENGTVIVPGKASGSVMLKRLRLPIESDDHMPPDGKPQPSAEEVALLEWWIDAGAPGDKKVKELKAPANITRILETKFGVSKPVAKVVAPRPLADILPIAGGLADELHVAITPLSPAEPWLQCNASIVGTNFGDAQLSRLATLGPNLRWLDLAGTAVTDAGLGQLSSMPNLTRLHLERTAVTDVGAEAIATNNTSSGAFAGLEYLNLYGTQLSDTGLEMLQKLPRLRQLYLWQTKVTPTAATNFVDARTDKDQIARWEEEIEQLKAKIREQHISVELGINLATTSTTNSPAGTNATPLNAQCPVSGKPIDPTKTVLHEGVLVAFCCDDCKAQFQKDPKPFLAKLASAAAKNDNAAGKP